ncbi:MAG: tetratricopeptide repeat protein, partial [Anaerolineae bacterium]
MYLSRRRRKRSNPWRVLLLLLLIGAAGYAYVRVQPQEVEVTIVPTPTPTRSPQSYQIEADGYYWDGDLRGAIAVYQQAIGLFPNDVSLYPPLVRLLVLDGKPLEA